MKRIAKAIFIALVFFGCNQPATRLHFEGLVVDSSDQPLDSVLIQVVGNRGSGPITDGERGVQGHGVTGSDGRFKFSAKLQKKFGWTFRFSRRGQIKREFIDTLGTSNRNMIVMLK